MTEVEDPVATLVRLLKTNMRVINDNGSLANIHVSREWCDRELLKSHDGQVTVGLHQPSPVKPLNLDHSLSQRILNFKVDGWVVDKTQVNGNRLRSKLREEILRIIREKRVKPNETVYDFYGLGTSGPHDAYHAASSSPLVPSSANWAELTNTDYEKTWSSDDVRFSKSTSEGGKKPQILFKLKLESSKYDPHENNVKRIVLSFEGYGSSPYGSGCRIWVWNHIASAWQNTQFGLGSGDETIIITLTSSLTNYIEMDSSGVGYVYLLAETYYASDGVSAAEIYCDYAKCVLTVEGLTHVKFGSYNDADETSVKPFLWHTEFSVVGWMFENVQAT